MKLHLWPRGLRSRLIAAFALVTMLGAAVAAWGSTQSASSGLVESNQRQIEKTFLEQIQSTGPTLTYPPDQAALDRLRNAVGTNSLVIYDEEQSIAGERTDLVTDDLRDAVAEDSRLHTQRVTDDGSPWLLLGTPLIVTEPDGTRTRSGIEVFTVRDLSDIQLHVDDLATSAFTTAAWALPLALGLALLAARSVVRPVRELRDTALQLADGDLDARTAPRGSDELADLSATVNNMAESLQDSMQRMQRMQDDARRFSADVSHELRTPLSTLTAVVEVLAGITADLDGDARESAQLAITETRRLVQLVEDLMEVSRFDAGTVHLQPEDVNIAAAVRTSIRSRGWIETVTLDAPDTLHLRVDPRRLDVIVANLVGNALRHGEPPVNITVSQRDNQVTIDITDQGPGLPNDLRAHVFDRFYKADTARTRTAGSGLGLAIARENARLHGGDLTARNEAGGGATFTIHLPTNQENP